MFHVKKEALQKFLVESKRYIVPFFQRGYVWKEENWQELWDNITEIYRSKKQEEHFLGTVIVRHITATSVGATGEFDLIDGQQRFTTFSILLKALAETCTEEETTLKKNIEKCLYFKDDNGKKFLRIEHSENDKNHYEEILNDPGRYEDFNLTSPGETQPKLVECYIFFRKKIKELEKINDPDNKIKLKKIILEKTPVVSMLLGEKDDAQEIFDTVNSLGVRLTVAELIKNHIFQDKKLRDEYQEYWGKVFEQKDEDDEETIKFWTAGKKAGRIYRTNIELLLYCFLIIQKRKSFKMDTLFREYKKWWKKQKSVEDKINALKELRDYAKVFRSFPLQDLDSIKPNEYDKRLFRILDALSVTTPYPLILSYCKKYGEDEKEKRSEFFRTLEGYLMRRYVCKFTEKGYNNLFLDLMLEFIKKGTTLGDALLEYKTEVNKFPKDAELKEAFSKSHLINKIAKEVLYAVALNQINGNNGDIDSLSGSYSLEHIMPRQWKTNWQEPDKPLSPVEAVERDNCLKTLGNLTLVSFSMNPLLSNKAWHEKRKDLKGESALKITTDYLEKDKWDEKEIEKRGKDLYKVAKEVWPRPS